MADVWQTRRVSVFLRLASSCFAIAAVVVGCQCEEPLDVQEPDIAVAPAELDLGVVRVGDGTEHVIQIGNRGQGTLQLRSVVIEPADTGFTLVPPADLVLPGQAIDAVVRLDPLVVGAYAADLIIDSNDPDTPRVVVPLRAEGGPAILTVTPSPLDFGIVNEGPGAVAALRLENTGLDTLAVREAHFSVHGDDAFRVDDDALPVVLAPGASAELPITLFPDAVIADLVDDDGLLRDTLAVSADSSDRDLSTTVEVFARINRAPIAVAVEDRTRRSTAWVAVGVPVTIDGSDTVDPEGDAFTYAWSVVERPEGSAAVAINATAPKTRVVADALGRYSIRLRATDEHGAFADAFAELLPRDLAVVLTWAPAADAACGAACDESDLDLHLVGPDVDGNAGVVGDYGVCPIDCEDVAFCSEASDEHVDSCRSTGLDCAFANRAPEWGVVGRSDDPSLDIDDVRGRGPEIVSLNTPADGTYRLAVHYCNDRGDEATDATIEIFDEGVSLGVLGPQRIVDDQLWSAGVLQRSNGAWSLVRFTGVVEAAPAGLCDG